MKANSKLLNKVTKLPFKTKVAHKTKSFQKVAEQLVETPNRKYSAVCL
jgi:uncharacterized protein (DUF1919 family)